jgi:hypothetical protein
MRRAIRYATFAGLLAFVIAIVWLIWRTPPTGEPTPAALAIAYQRAIMDHDADALVRLVARPPDDPAALQPLLQPTGCPTEVLAVAADGDQLTLTAAGVGCAWVPITEQDGRWLIDPWAQPVHRPS